jgi:hypothetical protein
MEEGTATPPEDETATPPVAIGDRLKPLDVAQTLDAAVDLYAKNAVMLWQLVAIVIVPLTVIAVVLVRVTVPGDVHLHNGSLYSHGTTSAGAYYLAVGIVALLGLLGLLLATGAVFKLQLDAYLGEPHDIRKSLRFAFARHRLLSLLWIDIIATVMIGVGLILLVIPAIYLFVALSVAVPVLMLEGQKGMAAISRSINLVAGRWWPTFGRLLVPLVIYIVSSSLIRSIGTAISSGTTNITLFEVINGVVQAVIWIAFAPFIAAIINVTYIDLRVRKEGADHGTLMAGGPPSGPPPGVVPLPVEPLSGPPSAATPPTMTPPAPPAEPPPGEPPPSEPPGSQPPGSQPPPSPGV